MSTSPPTKNSPSAAPAIVQSAPAGQPVTLPLRVLDLDESNPRFGKRAGTMSSQKASLDYIVDSFGVDNLLASLGINGFFDAEPLIVQPKADGRYTVVEGNRRLAACLILAGDERAANQTTRIGLWQEKAKSKWSSDTEVPVRVFDAKTTNEALLPYLGVRHLVASQPWDSYAKAKWIADVINSKQMTMSEIVEVIGDKNGTIERLLEGYYFVNQIAASGKYDTRNSVRKGRGSNPEYPFSWVYTLLDNSGVREWLELGERKVSTPKVIAAARMDDAAQTMRYLLGDKSESKNPAIADSREIGLLASALSDPDKRSQLRQGKNARDIDLASRPAGDLFADYVNSALDSLINADALVSGQRLPKTEAFKMLEKLSQTKSILQELINKLV